MKKPAGRWFVALALVLASCDGGDGNAEIRAVVDHYQSVTTSIHDEKCRCYEALFGPPCETTSFAMTDCMAEVLGRYPDAAAYLECTVGTLEPVAACYAAIDTCETDDDYIACDEMALPPPDGGCGLPPAEALIEYYRECG
jgi:hypothetical protein